MATAEIYLRPEPRYTIEEYLEMERKSEERHEYLDGVLIEMSGESGEHGDITMNLSRTVSTQLLGTPCRARSKDTKVRSGPVPVDFKSKKGLFSYPVLVVIRGEPQYLDRHRDVVTNPSVVIEVLSQSTEQFDRTTKFMRYNNWHPTLTDYVLVAQTKPVIEMYSRQADGSWNYRYAIGLESSLAIQSINCTLNLTEVYDRVAFPPDEEDEPTAEAALD